MGVGQRSPTPLGLSFHATGIENGTMTILVFGSLNMDLVVQSSHLPVPGETLLGRRFQTIPGGKGANQAVAAARQQVPTQMMGRVGADGFGHELCQGLAAEGIDVTDIQVDREAHTGVAAIAVSDQGENHIVVVPGANGQIDGNDLGRLEAALPQAHLLLLQFEIPIPAVIAAAQRAHRAGVTVMVDPAPAQPVEADAFYPYVDILTPNQIEAGQLVGFPVTDIETASKAAVRLQRQGVKRVLIKLGAQGVVYTTDTTPVHIPAFPVEVVDTVAAGDAFNGGLAAALYGGKSWNEAVKWAAATAALSVTQSGAQPSMPSRPQVEAFFRQTRPT